MRRWRPWVIATRNFWMTDMTLTLDWMSNNYYRNTGHSRAGQGEESKQQNSLESGSATAGHSASI
jgi:hypothetical protein